MFTAVLSPSRRRVCFTFLAAIFLCLSAHTAQEGVQAADPGQGSGAVPTGVVWILLDACRSDHLSCYGYERETSPNIDALAKRGTLFERNYAQAPNTLLSVPTYMTGRFEPVFYQDARHLSIWFLRAAPEDEVLIATIFSENDFETAMFSASPWYTHRSKLARSFDTFEWLRHGPNVSEGSFKRRNPTLFRWLDEHAARPFFLYIHTLDIHEPRFENNTHEKWLRPSFPPARDNQLRRWTGAPFSAEDQEHIRNLYDGGISYTDGTVGEVMHKLKSLGILESTLVIISSDHGEVLGQDGKTLGHPGTESYDDLLQTPLIVAGPGIPSNLRVTTKSQNADIVPTIVALLALKTTAKFDGQSFLPQLRSPHGADAHPYVYARTEAVMLVTEPNRVLIFDDMKFDISPIPDGETEHSQRQTRKPVEVWAMPDAVNARRAIEPPPARTAAALEIVRKRFLPLWEAKKERPKVVPKVFYMGHPKSIVPDAITRDDKSDDKKWHYHQPSGPRGLRGLVLHANQEDDFLVSYAWLEDAPGLIFGILVPNGTYKVSVFCKTVEYGNVNRGSSFRFLVAPEQDYRLFELEPATTEERNKKWFDIGTYTITEGEFVYWIDEGNKDDFSVIGSLKFMKVGKVVPKVFYIGHPKSIVPDAITRDDKSDDKKWHYHQPSGPRGPRGLVLHANQEDDFLVSYAWLEDAPGLIFGILVPNGTYKVSVFCKTVEYGNVNRGSSFRFLVAPEQDYRLFELEPATTEEPNKKWFDIGTYTITEDEFVYWIDEGNKDDFSVIGSLKFVQVGADDPDIPTAKELEEERERLQSLGYIN